MRWEMAPTRRIVATGLSASDLDRLGRSVGDAELLVSVPARATFRVDLVVVGDLEPDLGCNRAGALSGAPSDTDPSSRWTAFAAFGRG
jgi:hypothetical protein